MNLLKYIFILLFVQSFMSCHGGKVNDDDIGVYFKRFGGGVDTSRIIYPGEYSIPNWDYITTYKIVEDEGEFIYNKATERNYRVRYSEFQVYLQQAKEEWR